MQLQRDSGLVFWSTTRTIAEGIPSITGAIETLLAVIVYWWLAIYFETYLPLLISAAIAPLVLLRSEASVNLGLKWFERWEKNASTWEWIGDIPQSGREEVVARALAKAAKPRQVKVQALAAAAVSIIFGYVFASFGIIIESGWFSIGTSFIVGWLAWGCAAFLSVFFHGLTRGGSAFSAIATMIGSVVGVVLGSLLIGGTLSAAVTLFGCLLLPVATFVLRARRSAMLPLLLISLPLFGYFFGIFVLSIGIRAAATIRFFSKGWLAYQKISGNSLLARLLRSCPN